MRNQRRKDSPGKIDSKRAEGAVTVSIALGFILVILLHAGGPLWMIITTSVLLAGSTVLAEIFSRIDKRDK
jgi:hypothetical protein